MTDKNKSSEQFETRSAPGLKITSIPRPPKKWDGAMSMHDYYYVTTYLGTVVNNKYNEGNIYLLNYDVPMYKIVMTENEADEFVDRLAELKARKFKVEY